MTEEGMKKRMNRGMALVEIIVALGIAVIVIVALVSIVVTSVSNVNFSKTQGEATRYAREGMEWLRGERDRSWDTFNGKSGNTWCLPSLTWPGAAGACGQSSVISNTVVRRQVELVSLSSTEIEARLWVSWTDAKGTHEVRLNSRFTKWR